VSQDLNEPTSQPAPEPPQQPEPPQFEPDYELIDYSRRGQDPSQIEYPERGQQYFTKDAG
jgi:hypothetical protein